MTERPRLAARKHSERPHVLIISDDPSLATFLNEGLPLGGFWTTVIASGLQALEVFRLRQFEIVIIDWELHSFNAIELMRRLRGKSSRSMGSTSRTTAPFVVVSEHPADISDDEQRQLDISMVFSAPIELDELAPQLHAVFEEWRERYPTMPLSDSPLRENR